MIDWLREVSSKQESLDNINKESKRSKHGEQNLGKENKMITSERIKEFIIFMTSSKRRLCRPTIYLR